MHSNKKNGYVQILLIQTNSNTFYQWKVTIQENEQTKVCAVSIRWGHIRIFIEEIYEQQKWGWWQPNTVNTLSSYEERFHHTKLKLINPHQRVSHKNHRHMTWCEPNIDPTYVLNPYCSQKLRLWFFIE